MKLAPILPSLLPLTLPCPFLFPTSHRPHWHTHLVRDVHQVTPRLRMNPQLEASLLSEVSHRIAGLHAQEDHVRNLINLML